VTATPFLTTDRLILRRFTLDDVDLLVELDSHPDVMRYLTGGRPTPRENIERERLPWILDGYERHGLGWWAAHVVATGEFIGWFGLRPQEGKPADELELGYRLRPAAWGKEYATEGSRALVDKAFRELGASRVVAYTMTVNRRSRRVMEKVGLKLVRHYFEDWGDPIEGSDQGDVEYAISKAEWLQMPEPSAP
jgi:RimJ/RimL family protein N-acetyltransferase